MSEQATGPFGPVALDELPRRAARAYADRLAVVRNGDGHTFAELDARIDAVALALVDVVGTGQVIGVPSVLSPEFAVAFYGVARSGNVVVTVNPFLREEALGHIVAASGMRLLMVSPALADRVDRIVADAPRLSHLVAFDTNLPLGSGGRLAAAPTLSGLEAGYLTAGAQAARTTPVDLEATACIHFTSGTTGRPKGVRLSHRNLSVNAAQVADGHRLDSETVVVNHLPTFHLMHLNAAVHAGATQVLCPADDPGAAIDAANQHRARRLYSLPVRLARLADDPRLPELRLDTVEAILSGGSALSPAAAQVLSAHFGIPVTQGYGLAETSPLTHTERVDAPRTGSVGQPVRGTEGRIVDLETRQPVPVGARGEVQVRGPQVMAGYLDPAQSTGIDADGWFSTGDVGYVDHDGYLFLVDRLGDVFKCDNELVSPSELERVVVRHPAVAECVVVDRPHPYHGAVAHAYVVLRDGAAGDPDDIRDQANRSLPPYEQLRHVTVVTAIPRSANGKIQRRDIRAWTRIDDGAVPPSVRPASGAAPTTGETTVVTLVNQLTVTGDPIEFERINAAMSAFMAAQPGYLSHRLLRSLREPEKYVEIAEWENPESHLAAVRSDTFQGFVAELGRVVSKPTPGLFADVKVSH